MENTQTNEVQVKRRSQAKRGWLSTCSSRPTGQPVTLSAMPLNANPLCAMKIMPNTMLLSTTVLVALSTAVLPFITGYGTLFFQVVVLGAWGVVAKITTGMYADQHHGPVWLVALMLNVFLFLIPAISTWVVLRRRKPDVCSALLASWCIFYLASLFVLFPASDGP